MHTVSRGGKTYDVAALWEIVRGRTPIDVAVAELHIDRSSRSGFSLCRYQETDLSYPIIIWRDATDPRDRILDGRHRAAKARDRGLTTISAVFVSTEELEQTRLAGRP